MADVLFGDVNPGGKLPLTFPQHVGQVPLYYNHKPSGRGDDYTDLSGKPLFPFGHGLSYTTFTYANLDIAPAAIPLDGAVEVRVDVKNTGNRTGDEVVQLYVRDPVASFTRPVKELKAFHRITLAPGAQQTVTFALKASDHGVSRNRHETACVEPGMIEVMVGSSSEDIRRTGSFAITGKKK